MSASRGENFFAEDTNGMGESSGQKEKVYSKRSLVPGHELGKSIY
jgi:hypothetical protein